MSITMSCGMLLASTSIFCTSALAFLAGHSRQCTPWFSGSSLAEGLEVSWVFSQCLTCLICVRPHTCWMDCPAWSIHDLTFTGLHTFSSLIASWSGNFFFFFLGGGGFCIALRHALTCSTLCLISMDGRSSR